MVRYYHTKTNIILVAYGYCATITDQRGTSIGDHALKGCEVTGVVKGSDFDTLLPVTEIGHEPGAEYRLKFQMTETAAILSDVILRVEEVELDSPPSAAPKIPAPSVGASALVNNMARYGYATLPPPAMPAHEDVKSGS